MPPGPKTQTTEEVNPADIKFNIRAGNEGGSNEEFFRDNISDTTGLIGDSVIIANINKAIRQELAAAAKKLGANPIVFEQLFEHWNFQFWMDVERDLFTTLPTNDFPGKDMELNDPENSPARFLTDPDKIQQLLGYARQWYGNKIPGVAEVWGGSSDGGGRSGPKPLTEEEIRAKYDLDSLSARVDDLYRSLLLTEADDPRGLAKSYVDQIVRNPEQVLDFDEFIRGNHIEQEPRYAFIYENKPSSMSEEQFLQPYFQTAQRVLRPDNAAAAAIGGAQFQASAGAFAERLGRSNENITSSSFIQGLEGRMRSLKGVLKG